MPTNGAGTYTVPSGVNPVVAGTLIMDTWANPTLTDVAQGITDRLDRNGRGAMLAQFKSIDGVVGGPGMSFGSELTSGWYRETTGTISLALLGVKKLGMSAALFAVTPPATFAGTVGISGTVSMAALSASGTITSSANEALRINNNTGFISGYDTAGLLRTGYIQWSTAGQIVYAAENGAYHAWEVGGAARMRLGTDGGLVLGVGTAILASDGNTVVMSVKGVTTPVLDLVVNGTRTASLLATSSEVRLNAITNVPATVYTNNLERLRVNASGEVGIGVTAAAKLHVLGTEVRLQTSDVFISGYNTAGATRNGLLQFRDGSIVLEASTNIPIIFNTNGVERARLLGTSELLIARTVSRSLPFRLQVGDGSADTRALFTSSNGLSIGVSQAGAGSNGVYSIGASASASAPSLLFTNDAGSVRMTLTDAGVLQIATGPGSLTMAGGITRFESAEQTCPSTTTLASVAHGGIRVPDLMQLVLRCKITEGGWAVGDEIDAQMDDGSRAMHLWANATNLGFNYVGAGVTPSIRNTSGTLIAVTAANWRLVLRAHWL